MTAPEPLPPEDPSGGQAAADAAESATTGPKAPKSSPVDVRALLAHIGDNSLKMISESEADDSGPGYRIVRSTEVGHVYVSPSLKIRDLKIWLEGWIACAADKNQTPA